MCPEGQRGLPRERPPRALEPLSTLEPRDTPRALVVEPHPAVRTVLEYLLGRERYAVEACAAEASFVATPGPALLLVAAGGGLCVFVSKDAAETFDGLIAADKNSPMTLSGATGMQAFLPKPFGAEDVLRVARMVRGFEGRRRAFGLDVGDKTGEDG